MDENWAKLLKLINSVIIIQTITGSIQSFSEVHSWSSFFRFILGAPFFLLQFFLTSVTYVLVNTTFNYVLIHMDTLTTQLIFLNKNELCACI